jgi:hypothetical protein
MTNTHVLILLTLFSGSLFATEYQPYPDAKISQEQWQEYYDTVESEHSATREEVAEAKLVLFHDEANSLFYAFTLPDHPAYPAWITRKLVERNGEISIEQIGYFAGDEEPFAALFDDYLALVDEIQSELQSP